jgi:hypothetical protein
MASNKANTLHPPQTLNSQPVTGLLPVKSQIYRAIAELNAGFDKVIHDFGDLTQMRCFRSEPLLATYDLICQLRARANREFFAVLNQREAANAAHFERLCAERGISLPASVLSQEKQA